MTNRIYCYHEDLGSQNHNEVVPYWETIWRKHGWIPTVLTRADAQRHELYADMLVIAEHRPTVNNRGFSTVNFLRWLAFAQIEGVVTDADVLPRVPQFPPDDYPDFFCGDPSGGPGFIAGKPKDFEGILNHMISYQQRPEDLVFGKAHVCDMTILQANRQMYGTIKPIVICYGAEGWRRYPLTHFGNAYLQKKVSKVQEMAQILKAEGAIHE